MTHIFQGVQLIPKSELSMASKLHAAVDVEKTCARAEAAIPDLWKQLLISAVKRHQTDCYEIWALTDHEISNVNFELDPRQTSNGLFSERENWFWGIENVYCFPSLIID